MNHEKHERTRKKDEEMSREDAKARRKEIERAREGAKRID